ncbi:hypothetical protein ACFL00_02765 [Pseudomonadota bacterium]
MKRKPKGLKVAEEKARSVKDAASASIRKIGGRVKRQANELNEQYKITEHTEAIMDRTKEQARGLDERHKISEKAKAVTDFLTDKAKEIQQYANEKGLTEQVKNAGKTIENTIIRPVREVAEKQGVNAKVAKISEEFADRYGIARAWIKPYFAPETPDELLRSTKSELIYINACILQISRDQAEQLANKLGVAMVSKIAGVASVGTLLGMVSTFGTASTGTAIASLHGAAATNATLYWVGSLLGGGMAAGAVLTGGVALAVGYSVYKLIGSKARSFEDLSESERQIVEATGFLIAAINDVLNDPTKCLNADEASLLLQNTLRPLHQSLLDHADDICENLDNRHKLVFRQHAIVDFEKSVLDGFEFFINEENEKRRRYPEYVVAGVIYALLTRSVVDDSRESQLALGAIRRIKTEWNEASESQLSDDLSQYDPEQLKGVANNAKGIYHEMLFVDNYNNTHEDTYAEMFVATNHPGADIQIKTSHTHEVLAEFQLKATSSNSMVNEHFEKYPDIDVLATEEVAMASKLAESSGISNVEITEHMDLTVDDISDNTILDRTEESAELAGLVAAGREAIKVIGGKRSMSEAGINAAKAATVAATSTALVAYFFS